MIEFCKEEEEHDEVRNELAKGTPKRFAGSYVHELLYDQFLQWLDKRYAIKVSKILRNIHMDANRKILQEKDNKIDDLSKKMDKMLEVSNKILGQNQEIKLTLNMTRDELSGG